MTVTRQQFELAISKGNDGIEARHDVALHRKVMMFCHKIAGPFAIIRTCTICGFSDSRQRGAGRGSGMREGNKQRGRIYQHLIKDHQDYIDHLRG